MREVYGVISILGFFSAGEKRLLYYTIYKYTSTHPSPSQCRVTPAKRKFIASVTFSINVLKYYRTSHDPPHAT